MSEFLQGVEPWADLWFANLWRASWLGAIAIALAWMIASGCKFLWSRIVCWIWRLACLKLLFALFWTQPVLLAVLPAKSAAPVAANLILTGPTAPVAAPRSWTAQNDMLPAPGARPAEGASAIHAWLLFPWLAGVLYCLGRIARQWQAVGRLLRSTAPVSSDSLQEICRQEAVRLAIRRPPRLRLSSQINGPLLAGVWRPAIVLPADAEETFDSGELRLILAHELAHQRRRDLLWNWLPAMVGAMFFFHPLVWLLNRRWSEAQEAACDELLIQNRLVRPAEYGRLLLKLSGGEPLGSQLALATAGVLGAYRNLERRILTMTRVRPFSFGRLAMAVGTCSLIAASTLIPWRLAAQEAAAPAAPEDKPGVTTSDDHPPGKIFVWALLEYKTDVASANEYRGVIAIDPNTGEWEKVGVLGQWYRLSPDGRRMAFSELRQPGGVNGPIFDLFVADVSNPHPTRLVEEAAHLANWSPDGKRLLYGIVSKDKDPDAGWRGTSWTIDLATKEKRKLPVPETDEVDDWSPRGDWLVTVSDRHPPFGSGYQLYVMHSDGTGERRLTQGAGLNVYPRFSPDGNRIVYDHQRRGEDSLWIVDVDGSNARRIMVSQNRRDAQSGACWSPDGRWLAVRMLDWNTGGQSDGNWRLAVVAADGGSPRVLELKDVTATKFLQIPDWK